MRQGGKGGSGPECGGLGPEEGVGCGAQERGSEELKEVREGLRGDDRKMREGLR